jgi:glycogen(starch) synthase
MMMDLGHDVEVFTTSSRRKGSSLMVDGVLVHYVQWTDREKFGVAAGHAFALRHAEAPFDVLEGPEYKADARVAVKLVPDIPLVVRMHTPSLTIARLTADTSLGSRSRHAAWMARRVLGGLLKGKSPDPISFRLPVVQDTMELDRVEAAHAREADIVASPCMDLCEHARLHWSVAPDAVHLLPYPYAPNAAYMALMPNAQGYTVGYVGRMERRKGIEDFVASIPAILDAIPKARIKFIGSPVQHPTAGVPYDKWLLERLKRFGDRVECLGKFPLAEMPSVYASLDICVYPSIWENFPNVCLEAMSAARAVVATRSGGMHEMLEDGKHGRVVPPQDHRALSAAVIALLRDPAERIRSGHSARQRILDAYDPDHIGKMTETVFLEAIRRRKLAGPRTETRP